MISTSARVPEKGGDVTLSLSADETVKNHSGLFRILLLGTDPSTPRIKPAQASLDLELPVGKQLSRGNRPVVVDGSSRKAEKKVLIIGYHYFEFHYSLIDIRNS